MAQKGSKRSPEQMQQQSARRESHPASALSLQGELHPLLQLQRTIGNRAVTRLLQAKLAVSHPGDPYEREADRVAEQVTSMSVTESAAMAQRQMIPDEEKDTPPLQTKPLAASITPLAQRQAMLEDEQKEAQPEQMQSTLQRAASEESVDAGPSIEQQLSQSSGQGSPLPASVRSYMEPRFGANFSGVRVHTGSNSTQLNRALNAQAFTVGQDIYYGGGKSPTDLSLTAHELTHVVQQVGEPREPQSDFAHSFQGGLHPIHHLQWMLGNRRVAQLIQAKRLTPAGKVIGLQRKLTVGAADDQYEQEADRVARQVMKSSRPPKSAGIAPPHRSHLMRAARLQSRQNRIAPGAIYVQRQPAAAPVPVPTTDVPYPPARPNIALPSRQEVVVPGAAPPATEQMPDLGIDATAEFWGIPEVGPYVDQLVAGWQSRLAAQGKTVDVASTRASLVTDFDETMQGWYSRSQFFNVPWASLEQRVLQLLARERQRLNNQATRQGLTGSARDAKVEAGLVVFRQRIVDRAKSHLIEGAWGWMRERRQHLDFVTATQRGVRALGRFESAPLPPGGVEADIVHAELVRRHRALTDREQAAAVEQATRARRQAARDPTLNLTDDERAAAIAAAEVRKLGGRTAVVAAVRAAGLAEERKDWVNVHETGPDGRPVWGPVWDRDSTGVMLKTAEFVLMLIDGYGPRFTASSYGGHGGGSFAGRGRSLDLRIPETEPSGFFEPNAAIRFALAIDAAASGVGVQWRALYNDFAVARAVNERLGQRRIVEIANTERQRGVITNINWHGPLVNHFHLDLAF